MKHFRGNISVQAFTRGSPPVVLVPDDRLLVGCGDDVSGGDRGSRPPGVGARNARKHLPGLTAELAFVAAVVSVIGVVVWRCLR